VAIQVQQSLQPDGQPIRFAHGTLPTHLGDGILTSATVITDR